MIIAKYTHILKYINYFCVLLLIGCAKQSEKQKNVTEKFKPTHYIALTNINLDIIQSSKRKALIDELNSLPCHCPECTPGISLAQCITTNKFCQYSKVQSEKIIQIASGAPINVRRFSLSGARRSFQCQLFKNASRP